MCELERTKVGEFDISESITIEELDESNNIPVITIEKLFENLSNIKLEDKELMLFLNGVKLTYEMEDGAYKIYSNGKFIGIVTIKNKKLKRDIIV